MLIRADTNRYVEDVILRDEYSFLFKGLVVIDIGCNIGTFSFWIYDLAREIYAIDISKENIANMDATISQNNLRKIKTFVGGIGGRTRMAGIDSQGGSPGEGGWRLNDGSKTIPVSTLRKFMDDNNIAYADVVKMDVEGAEEEILLGDDFPHERVSTIVGEVHGVDTNLLKDKLEGVGYRFEVLGGHFRVRK